MKGHQFRGSGRRPEAVDTDLNLCRGRIIMILGLVQVQEAGENPRFPGPVVWEAGVTMVRDGGTQTRAGREARHQGRAAHEVSFCRAEAKLVL